MRHEHDTTLQSRFFHAEQICSSYDAVDPPCRIPEKMSHQFLLGTKISTNPTHLRCCIWNLQYLLVFFAEIIYYSNYLPYKQHLQPNNNLNWAFHCWDSRTKGYPGYPMPTSARSSSPFSYADFVWKDVTGRPCLYVSNPKHII